MEDKTQIQLTAAEISQIWAGYQNDTLIHCVLKYFSNHVEDPDIQPIVDDALRMSRAHIEKLTAFFQKENHPLPIGFSDQDVYPDAPRLFSDPFILNFMHQVGKLGVNAMSVAVALSARSDIYQFFSEGINEYVRLHKQTTDTLLSKGLYIRPPHLSTPQSVDFIQDKSFLSGIGSKRPLLSLEVTHLFDNIQRNALGSAVLMGFSQAAESKQVAKYLKKGKEIANKHVEIFGSILRKDDLNVPMSWGLDVTDSITPPFSDRLMTTVTTSLITLGMGFYGTSMASSMRSDLTADYARLTAEIAKFSAEGATLLIENGWLEEPPQAVDRDELVKQNKK